MSQSPPVPSRMSAAATTDTSLPNPSDLASSRATSTSKPMTAPPAAVVWGCSPVTAIRTVPSARSLPRRSGGVDEPGPSTASGRITTVATRSTTAAATSVAKPKRGVTPARRTAPRYAASAPAASGESAEAALDLRRDGTLVRGLVRRPLAQRSLDPLVVHHRSSPVASLRLSVANACVAWLRPALAVMPSTSPISSNERSDR